MAKAFVSLPFFKPNQVEMYNQVISIVKKRLPSLELIEPKDNQPSSDLGLTEKIETISRWVSATFQDLGKEDVLICFNEPKDLGGWVEYLSAYKQGMESIYLVEVDKLETGNYSAVLGKVSDGTTDYYVVINQINLLRELTVDHTLVFCDQFIASNLDEDDKIYVWFNKPNKAISLVEELPESKVTFGKVNKGNFGCITAMLCVGNVKKEFVTKVVKGMSGESISPVVQGLLNSLS